MAEVRGHGAAFDSSRGADPVRAARGMERAITIALADAGIGPEEIDALSAAANGSVRGDAAEAAGIAAGFAGRQGRAATLPVTAIKGLLGEALGAGGAFQVVDMLETMVDGRLPGVAGFERGDEGFALVPGPAADVAVRYALIDAMGFDGQHAALVLARA